MEIVSIILRLKDAEIKVTVEEAKELLNQLHTVFGNAAKEKEYIPYPVYPSYPTYPWWVNIPPTWQPTVIYNTGTAGKVNWDNTGTVCIVDANTGDTIDSYHINYFNESAAPIVNS